MRYDAAKRLINKYNRVLFMVWFTLSSDEELHASFHAWTTVYLFHVWTLVSFEKLRERHFDNENFIYVIVVIR